MLAAASRAGLKAKSIDSREPCMLRVTVRSCIRRIEKSHLGRTCFVRNWTGLSGVTAIGMSGFSYR